MKNEEKNVYMQCAQTLSKLSKAKRKQVAAIAVKDRSIISIGINGMPPGGSNECEYPIVVYERVTGKASNELKTKSECLHAEFNMIGKLARSTQSAEGCTVFQTLSPCMDCAKLMYVAGVKEVFYHEEYRDMAGITFLNNYGVKCESLLH